ncbi:hypothetical protein L1987_19658 [Smallanthus sonchifolius]|uniref:Uncharacterized protein n=1 Tax=Smallanthus sonchifolius TaxID=185202 RepID=A0ACB9IQF0_9ASTR|nr:hypothetical protein L1987_19658 [Smallanthus sonchifolius]
MGSLASPPFKVTPDGFHKPPPPPNFHLKPDRWVLRLYLTRSCRSEMFGQTTLISLSYTHSLSVVVLQFKPSSSEAAPPPAIENNGSTSTIPAISGGDHWAALRNDFRLNP